jgi:hypothetical protein
MILSSQRTMYGVDLKLKLETNQPYNTLPNTTLNEKFSKLANNNTNGKYPVLGYYAIGIGGIDKIAGTDTIRIAEHSPMDAALYDHIPFVIVPVDSDIDANLQNNYRLKIIQNINGEDYYCYYLKKIPSINLNNNFYKITTNDDNSVLSLLSTNTAEYLNPVPKNKTLTVDNADTITYAAKTAKLEFSLLNDEVAYLHDAMVILFGDVKPISEIGIVTGIDIDYNAGVNCDGKEVTCAQIAYHVNIDLDLSMYLLSSTEVMRSIDIGGMEMYYV